MENDAVGQGRGRNLRKQKKKDDEEPGKKNDAETHPGHDAGPQPEDAGDVQDLANAEKETSSTQSELADCTEPKRLARDFCYL